MEAIDIQKAKAAAFERGKATALLHYRDEGCCDQNKFPKYSDEWWGYREVANQKLREEILGGQSCL